jgi:hypothetical protein
MADLVMLLELALQGGPERGLEQFGREPVLTLACVLLITVSLAWLVIARRISRNLHRAERDGRVKVDSVRPARDIWKEPP